MQGGVVGHSLIVRDGQHLSSASLNSVYVMVQAVSFVLLSIVSWFSDRTMVLFQRGVAT